MHGVNLDQLGRRDPAHYGGLSFDRARAADLRHRRASWGCRSRFFQTNHEGEFVEHLHRLEGLADGLVLNPGAWTHYSYAIRDALELTGLPAVEVHLSDVDGARALARRIGDRASCASAGSRARDRTATVRRSSACARSSQPMSDRAERLVELLPAEDVRRAAGHRLVNVRYMTGYTGSNGLALVGPQTRAFVTDFRYVEQAADEVDPLLRPPA